MTFHLNKNDLEVLTTIAEYRILGIRHISTLHQRNAQALRRRLRNIEAKSLIRTTEMNFGKNRGRPERLISLTEEGVKLLKAKGALDSSIDGKRVTAERIRCLDHHLLTNDFRVQLSQMRRIVPALTVQFLSPFSPLLPRSSDDLPLVHERIRSESRHTDWIEFTPDGVFSITHGELGKTLLFFLEVDMGTETLASPRRSKQDVRQKIVNYQTYFRLQRFKRYEKMWKCRLRGFRLLFLTHFHARMGALCRLVKEMPPSDFIWLTDRGSLLSKGGMGYHLGQRKPDYQRPTIHAW